IVADASGMTTIPARQGRKQLMAVLHRIQGTARVDRSPDASLHQLLRRASTVVRRRGLVVVISDFLDDPESWRHSLATLAGRRAGLCAETVGPREVELPKVGVLTLIDTETGRTREIDTNNRGLRDRYAAAAGEQRAAIRAAIAGSGARHLQLRTDGDWLLELAHHVAAGKRRHANVGGA